MQDEFTCPEGVSGRADKVLADYYWDFSRAFIKQSIEQRRSLMQMAQSLCQNPRSTQVMYFWFLFYGQR